ncbi:4305_t:CDS:2 [Ambispora leptoticha]|uniref:Vacuolar calcium ion transporter n=1 Tax=Ambispora leptoticha TaxID=144679 RepID=A0A9N9BR24_9GLOM|nr:4305_t:CDS:2 [Ambispora leptoticha]
MENADKTESSIIILDEIDLSSKNQKLDFNPNVDVQQRKIQLIEITTNEKFPPQLNNNALPIGITTLEHNKLDEGTKKTEERTKADRILHRIGINFLLVLLPFGMLSNYLNWGDTFTFVFNFLALLPLSHIMDKLADSVSEEIGQTLGSFFHVTFGNSVDLILATITLKNGNINMVHSYLFGSIISSLLLILGLKCLIFGIKVKDLSYPDTTAKVDASLMTLSSLTLAVFSALMYNSNAGTILKFSRYAALLMPFIYSFYLRFKLKTHQYLYIKIYEQFKKHKKRQFSLQKAFLLLVVVVLSGLSGDMLVNSIEGLVNGSVMNQSFIGLILLPIVAKVPEFHSVKECYFGRQKLPEAICEVSDTCVQISLFIAPFLVILGWIIGKPMTLAFGLVETIALFLSVYLTCIFVQGKSNWLTGILRLVVFTIIGMGFFYLPSTNS